jgi:transcriptional regulator with XRE-family HTH domain
MVEKKRSGLAKRLGKNIMRWRKALGLTQDQVATRLEVEPETISRFERGVTLPSLPTLARLAEVLGATMTQLLEEKAPPHFSGAEKLAARLAPLSKRDQAFVLDMMGKLCVHCTARGDTKKK